MLHRTLPTHDLERSPPGVERVFEYSKKSASDPHRGLPDPRGHWAVWSGKDRRLAVTSPEWRHGIATMMLRAAYRLPLTETAPEDIPPWRPRRG